MWQNLGNYFEFGPVADPNFEFPAQESDLLPFFLANQKTFLDQAIFRKKTYF